MDWSPILRALESDEIYPENHEKAKSVFLRSCENSFNIMQGERNKGGHVDSRFGMPFVAPAVLELNFENRIMNPSRVLRLLTEMYPNKEFHNLKTYLYICMALANHYLERYRRWYDRCLERQQNDEAAKLKEIEDHKKEIERNFQIWLLNAPNPEQEVRINKYFTYDRTPILSTNLAEMIYQINSQEDMGEYKKLFKSKMFPNDLQYYVNR